MTNVSLGDMLFIVLVLGIIFGCLHLAKSPSKKSAPKKGDGGV